MLISSALPQVTASQATTMAATLSALQTGSPSKPLTPVAVSATASAAGYSPQTPERRSAPNTLPGAALPTRAAILPDPEFWRVPDRQANPELTAQQVVQQRDVAVQQAATYNTQAATQDAAETTEPEVKAPVVQRKQAAFLGKKPGVGDSSGFGAYNVASQRSTQIDFTSTVEAFA